MALALWSYLQVFIAPDYGTDEIAFDQYAAQLHGVGQLVAVQIAGILPNVLVPAGTRPRARPHRGGRHALSLKSIIRIMAMTSNRNRGPAAEVLWPGIENFPEMDHLW